MSVGTMKADSDGLVASVAFLDRKGNPAKVDGAPVWSSSDEAVATVQPSEDGLSAVVTPVGVGECDVSVVADADLGEGVRSIQGTGHVQVLPGEAVSVEISFGPK